MTVKYLKTCMFHLLAFSQIVFQPSCINQSRRSYIHHRAYKLGADEAMPHHNRNNYANKLANLIKNAGAGRSAPSKRRHGNVRTVAITRKGSWKIQEIICTGKARIVDRRSYWIACGARERGGAAEAMYSTTRQLSQPLTSKLWDV